MSQICHKAQLERVGAIYVLGQLIIWAEGQSPTLCHRARIERWPFRIYPPQYQVVSCVDEGVICPQMLTTYRAIQVFTVSQETFEAMNGVAIVHHRDGAKKVKVTAIELPKSQMEALTADREADGQGIPTPFGLASGDVPFPLLLSDLLETGKGENIRFLTRPDVSLHTATGYSDTFSFTEAFQDAVANLPPDTNPFPDKLVTVRVSNVGAQYGGIVGFNRMFVTVVAFY